MYKNNRFSKMVSVLVLILFVINNISSTAPDIGQSMQKESTLRALSAEHDAGTPAAIKAGLLEGGVRVVDGVRLKPRRRVVLPLGNRASSAGTTLPRTYAYDRAAILEVIEGKSSQDCLEPNLQNKLYDILNTSYSEGEEVDNIANMAEEAHNRDQRVVTYIGGLGFAGIGLTVLSGISKAIVDPRALRERIASLRVNQVDSDELNNVLSELDYLLRRDKVAVPRLIATMKRLEKALDTFNTKASQRLRNLYSQGEIKTKEYQQREQALTEQRIELTQDIAQLNNLIRTAPKKNQLLAFALQRISKTSGPKIPLINEGRWPFEGESGRKGELLPPLSKVLEEGKDQVHATPSRESIAHSDVVVCSMRLFVGVDPTTSERYVNHEPLKKEIEACAPYFARAIETAKKEGRPIPQFNVLTTQAPGITRNMIMKWLEVAMGNKYSAERNDYHLSFTPSRVAPGAGWGTTIWGLPQLVGGITPEAGQAAGEFFADNVNYTETIVLPNPETVEAAKVTENAWSDATIAIANTEATVSQDVSQVNAHTLQQESNKRPNWKKMSPGMGVGGYCFPKDPHFIPYTLRKLLGIPDTPYKKFLRTMSLGSAEKLYSLTRFINDMMPYLAACMVHHGLDEAGVSENKAEEANVVVAGLAYKEDVGDTRFAPSYDLIAALIKDDSRLQHMPEWVKQPLKEFLAKRQKPKIRLYDPYVEQWIEVEKAISKNDAHSQDWDAIYYQDKNINIAKDGLAVSKDADLLVLAVAHPQIRQLVNPKNLPHLASIMKHKVILDARNLMDEEAIKLWRSLDGIYIAMGKGEEYISALKNSMASQRRTAGELLDVITTNEWNKLQNILQTISSSIGLADISNAARSGDIQRAELLDKLSRGKFSLPDLTWDNWLILGGRYVIAGVKAEKVSSLKKKFEERVESVSPESCIKRAKSIFGDGTSKIDAQQLDKFLEASREAAGAFYRKAALQRLGDLSKVEKLLSNRLDASSYKKITKLLTEATHPFIGQRENLELAASLVELIDMAFLVSMTLDLDKEENILKRWKQIANFSKATFNYHDVDPNHNFYAKYTTPAFEETYTTREEKYKLFYRYHQWLYNYLRYLVTNYTEVKDYNSQQQRLLLDDIGIDNVGEDSYKTEERFGFRYSRIAFEMKELATRGFGPQEPLSRRFGFPQIIVDVDPAVIDAEHKVNTLYMFHWRAVPLSFVRRGPHHPGQNIIIKTLQNFRENPSTGYKEMFVQEGLMWMSRAEYEKALKQGHPVGKCISPEAVGDDGVLVIVKFKRPIRIDSAAWYTHHPQIKVIEESGLPTPFTEVSFWLSLDKTTYPAMFTGSSIKVADQITWRKDDTHTLGVNTIGAIRSQLVEFSARSESHHFVVIKPALESGGRGIIRVRVRDDNGGLLEDGLQKAAGSIYIYSEGDDVIVQECVRCADLKKIISKDLWDRIRNIFLQTKEKIDIDKLGGDKEIVWDVRTIPALGPAEAEPKIVALLLVNVVDKEGEGVAANIGQGGQLFVLSEEDIAMPGLWNKLRRNCLELMDYFEKYSPVYARMEKMKVGHDLIGRSYHHPDVALLDWFIVDDGSGGAEVWSIEPNVGGFGTFADYEERIPQDRKGESVDRILSDMETTGRTYKTLSRYMQAIADGEAIHPGNTAEQLMARTAAIRLLEKGKHPLPVEAHTNIKCFAGKQTSAKYYKDGVRNDTQGLSGVSFTLHTEEPNEVPHDLVGFLKTVSETTMPKKTNRQKLVILDGGKNTRNFLLTLLYMYQGRFPLLEKSWWRLQLETLLGISAQIPGSKKWLLGCASDIATIPEKLTLLDGRPLSQLPEDASILFFTLPVLDKKAEALLQEARGANYASSVVLEDASFAHLRKSLSALTAKGVAIGGKNSRAEAIFEKVSLESLVSFLLEKPETKLVKVVQIFGYQNSILKEMVDAFNEPCQADRKTPLMKKYAFGMTDILGMAPSVTLSGGALSWVGVYWINLINKAKGKGVKIDLSEEELLKLQNLRSMDKIEKETGRLFISKGINPDMPIRDWVRLREIAADFIKKHPVYLVNMGKDSINLGGGTTQGLLQATRFFAFDSRGQLQGMPQATGMVIQDSVIDPEVKIEAEGKALVRNSLVFGKGKVHLGQDAVLCNNIVYVPEGKTLNITGKGYYITSSSLLQGGTLSGEDGIVAGYGSSTSADSEGKEVVVAIGLKGQGLKEMRFPVGVNPKTPLVPGQPAPLETAYPQFGNMTFSEAQKQVDLSVPRMLVGICEDSRLLPPIYRQKLILRLADLALNHPDLVSEDMVKITPYLFKAADSICDSIKAVKSHYADGDYQAAVEKAQEDFKNLTTQTPQLKKDDVVLLFAEALNKLIEQAGQKGEPWTVAYKEGIADVIPDVIEELVTALPEGRGNMAPEWSIPYFTLHLERHPGGSTAKASAAGNQPDLQGIAGINSNIAKVMSFDNRVKRLTQAFMAEGGASVAGKAFMDWIYDKSLWNKTGLIEKDPAEIRPGTNPLIPTVTEHSPDLSRINKLNLGVFYLAQKLAKNPAMVNAMHDELLKINKEIKKAHGNEYDIEYLIWPGMGGSAEDKHLCEACGVYEGGQVKVFVLDSTDPASLKGVIDEMVRLERKKAGRDLAYHKALYSALKKSLVMVQALGMTSYEPVINAQFGLQPLFDYFKIDGAPHFRGMTIDGSHLDKFMREKGYVRLPHQPDAKATLSGRHDGPLSYGCLIPLILNGIDINRWIEQTRLSKQEIMTAMELAAWIIANVERGRDKITLFLPDEWKGAGLWIKQLFEEPLGKRYDFGLKIVIGETPDISRYERAQKTRDDRCYLAIDVEGLTNSHREAMEKLGEMGLYTKVLKLNDKKALVDKVLPAKLMQLLHHTVFPVAYSFGLCAVDQPPVETYKAMVELFQEKGLDDVEIRTTETDETEDTEPVRPWKSFNSSAYTEQRAGISLRLFSLLGFNHRKRGAVDVADFVAVQDGLKELIPDLDLDDPATIYAILHLMAMKQRDRFGKPAVQYGGFAHYGDFLRTADGRAMQELLNTKAAAFYRDTIGIPADVGKGPGHNHAYHAMDKGWGHGFITAIMPEFRQRIEEAPNYPTDYLTKQWFATIMALSGYRVSDNKEYLEWANQEPGYVVGITLDKPDEKGRAALATFFDRASRTYSRLVLAENMLHGALKDMQLEDTFEQRVLGKDVGWEIEDIENQKLFFQMLLKFLKGLDVNLARETVKRYINWLIRDVFPKMQKTKTEEPYVNRLYPNQLMQFVTDELEAQENSWAKELLAHVVEKELKNILVDMIENNVDLYHGYLTGLIPKVTHGQHTLDGMLRPVVSRLIEYATIKRRASSLTEIVKAEPAYAIAADICRRYRGSPKQASEIEAEVKGVDRELYAIWKQKVLAGKPGGNKPSLVQGGEQRAFFGFSPNRLCLSSAVGSDGLYAVLLDPDEGFAVNAPVIFSEFIGESMTMPYVISQRTREPKIIIRDVRDISAEREEKADITNKNIKELYAVDKGTVFKDTEDPLHFIKYALFFTGIIGSGIDNVPDEVISKYEKAEAKKDPMFLAQLYYDRCPEQALKDIEEFTRGGGLELTFGNPTAPMYAGFSSSSSASVRLLQGLYSMSGQNEYIEDTKLCCKMALIFENDLGRGTGAQDTTGVLEGFKDIHYRVENGEVVEEVKRLGLAQSILDKIERLFLVFISGVPRAASKGISERQHAYLLREPKKLKAIMKAKEQHQEMARDLENGQFREMAQVMWQYTLNRNKIHAALPDEMREVFESLMAPGEHGEKSLIEGVVPLIHGGELAGSMGVGAAAILVATEYGLEEVNDSETGISVSRLELALKKIKSLKPVFNKAYTRHLRISDTGPYAESRQLYPLNISKHTTESQLAEEAARDVFEAFKAKLETNRKEGRDYVVVNFDTDKSQYVFIGELVKLFKAADREYELEKGKKKHYTSRLKVIHTGEYLGLTKQHAATSFQYLMNNLISPLRLVASRDSLERAQFFFLADYNEEEYMHIIDELGGIDITCTGINMGFNVAPADFVEEGIKMVKFGEDSRIRNVRDHPELFATPELKVFTPDGRIADRTHLNIALQNTPQFAKTMTPRTILRADKVFLIAPGKINAEEVKAVVTNGLNPNVPATLLKTHYDATIYLDEASAGLLTPEEINNATTPVLLDDPAEETAEKVRSSSAGKGNAAERIIKVGSFAIRVKDISVAEALADRKFSASDSRLPLEGIENFDAEIRSVGGSALGEDDIRTMFESAGIKVIACFSIPGSDNGAFLTFLGVGKERTMDMFLFINLVGSKGDIGIFVAVPTRELMDGLRDALPHNAPVQEALRRNIVLLGEEEPARPSSALSDMLDTETKSIAMVGSSA